MVHQAADEPGATHATGEDSDLHGPQCVISEPLIGALVTLPIWTVSRFRLDVGCMTRV